MSKFDPKSGHFNFGFKNMTDLDAPLAPSQRPSFETRRQGDLLLIKTPRGSVLGLHSRELEVAQLDSAVWNLDESSSAQDLKPEIAAEIRHELALWQASRSGHDAPGDLFVRSLTVNVAQICNLACTYCAAGGDGTYGSKTKTPDLEKTEAQIAKLLEQLPEGESFTLTFLGGEPLLHPDIIERLARHTRLMAAGRSLRLRFDIVTNATLVDAERAELLAKLRAHVTVSMDGAPEQNDRARVTKSGRGSSELVLKGLEELLKVRDRLHSLNVGAVFGRHNLDVVGAWKYLSQLPFQTLKFDFAAEAGDETASRLFAEGLCEVMELAFAQGGEAELRRLHVADHLFRTLDDQLRVRNHCLAGKNHLQLDTNGRFTVCQWFVGQRDEDLGGQVQVDEVERRARFERDLVDENNCGNCWARYICGGGCMSVNKVKNGNKHERDLAFCDRTRHTLLKGIEKYVEARYNTTLDSAGAEREIH